MTTVIHPRSMLKYLVAALLSLHGAIHAAGFAWAFQLAEFDDLGGPTLLLDSSEPGDSMILVVGGLWMVATLAFIGAGIGIARTSSWGVPLAGAAAAVSLLVTVMWWNDARIGALLSAAILIGVVMVHRLTKERHARSRLTVRGLHVDGHGGTS